MNKNQFERIRKKIAEIERIIQEDTKGSAWIYDVLAPFKERVEEELKDAVWHEYEKQRE